MANKVLIGLLIMFNFMLGVVVLKDKYNFSLPEIRLVQDTKEVAREQVSTPKKEVERIVTPPIITKYPSVDITKVKDFAYYTSNVQTSTLLKSDYQMFIINEADKQSKMFDREDVDKMKSTGKIILADISVAHAESYRWYWKKEWSSKKPSFIGEEFLKGQYYVDEWWNDEWWKIVQGMIDKAVEAGYHGVVLDGIDVYIDLGASKALRDRMIDFVINISKYAKIKNPNFLVLPKNAELLGQIDPYLKAIDGMVKEDLIYSKISDGNKGPKNSYTQISKSMNDLNEFKKAGKPVFVIEYVSGSLWADAKKLIKSNGYIGYSSPGRYPSAIRNNVW